MTGDNYIYFPNPHHDKVKLIALIILIALALLITLIGKVCAEEINVNKLADAIYWAEGGANTNHPYGILATYKHTTPRQACINTIKSAIKRFNKQTKEKDFVHFLSLTYCPIGCDNDNGTNKYWEKNVKFHYAKLKG